MPPPPPVLLPEAQERELQRGPGNNFREHRKNKASGSGGSKINVACEASSMTGGEAIGRWGTDWR